MAGSFGHMTNDDGTPYDDRFGEGSMLENGGDVVEALEECYGMIWWLAEAVAYRDEDPSTRQALGRVPRERVLPYIERARAAHSEGVRLGKGN
jgi:hypothetical protein